MKHRSQSGIHGKLVIDRRMDDMNTQKQTSRTDCGGVFIKQTETINQVLMEKLSLVEEKNTKRNIKKTSKG
jgi:hypothetical protein